MTRLHSRRTLFGQLRGGPPQHRLPWTIGEDAFLEACTRCGACADACPPAIVAKGHGNYPIIDVSRAGCTFCGKCADACAASCFTADRAPRSAWALTAEIAASCVETKGISCRMCDDACDARAIRFTPLGGGRSSAEVATRTCTGCGACVSVCPVRAISIGVRTEVEATA